MKKKFTYFILGVHWLQNIVTYIGFEYCEVGIHQGKEHGVQLHFLHNFNYFPTPYSTGSPSYQLKQIVLMAKASLELCCQLRILPSMYIYLRNTHYLPPTIG